MKSTVHSLLTGAFEQRELILQPGERIDLGSNVHQFQTFRVITGHGIIRVDFRDQPLKTDDLIQVSAGLDVHISATGNFPIELFITSSGHI